MSIHNFSIDEFENVSKDILLHNKFISVRNSDKIDKDVSFHDVLDLTSLDIAEFVLELEEKYNVDMDFAPTGEIDSIRDVYKWFVMALNRKRHVFAQKLALQNQKQKA